MHAKIGSAELPLVRFTGLMRASLHTIVSPARIDTREEGAYQHNQFCRFCRPWRRANRHEFQPSAWLSFIFFAVS